MALGQFIASASSSLRVERRPRLQASDSIQNGGCFKYHCSTDCPLSEVKFTRLCPQGVGDMREFAFFRGRSVGND